MKLRGRCAMVTGANAGIGKAIAMRLAAEGADVALVDLSDSDITAAEVAASGSRTLAIRADVSSEAAVESAVEQAISAFGRIDILVNNAAMTAAPRPFDQIGPAEWRRMMDVNTLGPYMLSRATVPHMRKLKRGRIINVVSATFHQGVPFLLHYVSSKGAMIGFTRALARELGNDNITVNAIAPGFTLTERIAKQTERVEAFRRDNMRALSIKRDEVPEDLAGAASFFASDDSSFITGQTIIIDGGWAMI